MTIEVQDALQVEQTEEPSSDQNGSMTEESLKCDQKTRRCFGTRTMRLSSQKGGGAIFEGWGDGVICRSPVAAKSKQARNAS